MFSYFSKVLVVQIVCGILLIIMESTLLYWTMLLNNNESAYVPDLKRFQWKSSLYGVGLASSLLVSFYFFSQVTNGHFSNNLMFLNNNAANCDFLA